jgi:hypothetical protein
MPAYSQELAGYIANRAQDADFVQGVWWSVEDN